MDEVTKLKMLTEMYENVFCIRCRGRLLVGETSCFECRPAWEEAKPELKALPQRRAA